MKVLMVTNTFTPHVGGVARSVSATSQRLQALGHEVMIVCPTFEGTESTPRVLRVPAIEHFRNSDFSFPLPIPSGAHHAIDCFDPDIIHSHHPFLLGDTALRVGAQRDIPVVFTHHTQYDKYAHYIGGEDSVFAKRFINELDVGYCNLCDVVIAPSQSVADDLLARGVTRHIEVIPTGIDVDWWSLGSRQAFRDAQGIPHDAFVVGHVGRLAKEKNIPFLADAVAVYLTKHPASRFVVAGVGSSESEILRACEKRGVVNQLLMFGVLEPLQLCNLYRSLDVFVFASKSETQGIVLAEAMAAGVPVVAIDGPGVREIVVDKVNGRMLMDESVEAFAAAIAWIAELPPQTRRLVEAELAVTAKRYSLDHTVGSLLQTYLWAANLKRVGHSSEHESWNAMVNRAEAELNIWSNFANAMGQSIAEMVRGAVN